MQRLAIFVSLFFNFVTYAQAQIELPLEVEDFATVSFLGFGDSVTYGLGDGFPVGSFVEEFESAGAPGGYPRRLSAFLGVPTMNSGVPGEKFISVGLSRFPGVAIGSGANLIAFMEGANDALRLESSATYRHGVQKIINTATVLGKAIVLITIPPTCCNHIGSRPFISSFNDQLRDLARINSVTLADVAFAWGTTCENQAECELFNLPDGLHPNTKGYDVMAQTILATLLGVDIFVEGKAAELEEKLALPAGTIIVRPVPGSAEL